jgi:hypothetical protein
VPLAAKRNAEKMWALGKEPAHLVATSAFSQQLVYKRILGHEAFGIQPSGREVWGE